MNGINETVFYNLTYGGTVIRNNYINNNITIQNTLTVSSTAGWFKMFTSTVKIGTESSAGTVVNSYGIVARPDSNVTFQGVSSLYPARCTGNQFDWDHYSTPTAVWYAKWLDLQWDTATGGNNARVNIIGNMTFRGLTVSANGIVNASAGLITMSNLTVAAGGQMWFDNSSENISGPISATGNLWRYSWYPLQVINGSGSPISGAAINVTDSYGGQFISGTTDAVGFWYPHLFKSLTNSSGTLTVLDNLSAAKAGQWNSILINSSRGNNTITLGATQGYSVIGGAISGGFSPNVTVDGTPFAGPYSGTRTVELRNASQLVATFPHNFSSGDFDMNTVTVRLGQYWVGFAGRGATLYVPLRGTYCNVRTCSGITNASENCGAGWNTTDSEIQGWYCVLTINGTVAEEQGDPAITKLVAAPIRWELVAVLFGAAALIFVASGAKLRLRTTKRGRH
jgi:hypothetical protein